MSRLIKAKYENGVIKPLEPLELREGEEILVEIINYKERVEWLKKYRGILGHVGRKLLDELLKEAK